MQHSGLELRIGYRHSILRFLDPWDCINRIWDFSKETEYGVIHNVLPRMWN